MAGSLALKRLAVDNVGASRFDDQQLVGTSDVFPPVLRAENVDNITVALFGRVLVFRAAVHIMETMRKGFFNFLKKKWKKNKKEKKKTPQKNLDDSWKTFTHTPGNLFQIG